MADRGVGTLVGRARELAALRRQLDDATNGRGGVVLIGGEAGVGKTALAETICAEAERRGALVLIGRCYDLTETPPYGPWVEAFARYPSREDTPPLPEAFAARGTVGAVASQDALFRQVLDFFAALAATRPIVLLLDDLHWADPASLDLLRFLARNLAMLPVLLIATYRSDELTRRHPLYQMLPLLVREAHAERIDLHALGAETIRALVVAKYQLADGETDRLVSYLHARSEGNALFLGELLRSLEEGGSLARAGDVWRLDDLNDAAVPPLLRQVIDNRVARLDAESQRLLVVAAVIGQEMPLDVWGAVAEVDERSLFAAIEQAEHAGLLAEMPGGEAIRFAHALVREAIYEGEMATRRRQLHRAVGDVLAALPRPDPDAVAYHLQQAGDDRAVEWLIRAGERAHAAYAWVTGAARYEAALALMERRGDPAGERGWLLFAISRLRRYTDPSSTARALEEVLALAREAGDKALGTTALLAHGVARVSVGRRAEGVEELARGVEVAQSLSPEDRARIVARTGANEAWLGAIRGTWMEHAAYVGKYSAVLSFAEWWEALEEPPLVPTYLGWSYGDGWRGLGVAYAMTGNVARAEEAFGRALKTVQTTGQLTQISFVASEALGYLALPYRADRPAECEWWAGNAVDAYRQASGALPGIVDVYRAPLDFVQGRWDAPSLAQLRAVIAVRPDRAYPLSWIARERGDRSQAWEPVRTLLREGAAAGSGNCEMRWGLELQRVAVALSLDAADVAGAKAWLEAHNRWLAGSGAVLGRSEGQALWARYHRLAGDRETARIHAECALADASEPRQPLALLAAHRLLGELDIDGHHFEDAQAHLDAALALADACHAPYERALTLLALAELRAAMGERNDAMHLLDEVKAICEPLGARPILARVDALTERLAATPAATPAYPAGLSAREVEVLRLVAQGLTNPQVAERLFLSPRTIEQHLRSIYNKLGVSTRAAATRFAIEHRLA